MGKHNVPFSHQGFNERVQRFPFHYLQGAGENVAMSWNLGDPAKVAVDGWVKSPGHRKNLLGNFRYMGIGVYQNQEGRYYLTQMFAFAYV